MLETPEEMANLQQLLDAGEPPPARTCTTSSPTSAGSTAVQLTGTPAGDALLWSWPP